VKSGSVTYPIIDTYLTGDYTVKDNAGSWVGIPAGLNPGQVRLCNCNHGEFIMVSVNALGFTEDLNGHRAQNQGALETHHDGLPR
jgi:hypothetical protein